MTLATSLLLQRALAAKPRTASDLQTISGMSKMAVWRWLNHMRDEMHVVDYADDSRGRKFKPVYTWGKGVNAPRPGPRQTAAERVKAYRERKKAGLV